jgi:hypothetical protein
VLESRIHWQHHQIACATQGAVVKQSGEIRQRARIVTAVPAQDVANAFRQRYSFSRVTVCEESLIQRHVLGIADDQWHMLVNGLRSHVENALGAVLARPPTCSTTSASGAHS